MNNQAGNSSFALTRTSVDLSGPTWGFLISPELISRRYYPVLLFNKEVLLPVLRADRTELPFTQTSNYN